MWETYGYCPSCRELLYDDLQVEGQQFTPDPGVPFQCTRCGWRGNFSDLYTNDSSAAGQELDYQI
jgi:hypothetical protein